MMAACTRAWHIVAGCLISLLILYVIVFLYCPGNLTKQVPMTKYMRLQPPSELPPPGPCTCSDGSVLLKDHIPKEQYEELAQRRAKELQQHKARTTSVLSRLLYASPNSPLQYPIQGFIVKPLTSTLIPGLALHAEQRSSYKVSLNVSKGVLTTELPVEGVTIHGVGETVLVVESSSLVKLNDLLDKVSYTSTVYHIHTGDLASFQFENHEAMFPITIKEPQLPVLYDMGTGRSALITVVWDYTSSYLMAGNQRFVVRNVEEPVKPVTANISSHVTITTKTFLRYPQLKELLISIRKFYSNIEVIIADDNFKPEPITGEHIQHYIMPPAQGWFAGRNLAVSQVTTKYFLWVDDDFVFTEKTKIEKLVEVMEMIPELDVLGGAVQGDQFYFSLLYEKGEEIDGGCMYRKSKGKFHPLPGFPDCSLVSGVVNFFLARTDAVQRVGFDPKLKRVAHSEFFMDGLGSLLVASCGHVSIGHQHTKPVSNYVKFRHPGKGDEQYKLQLHFFKNNLKCIRYG